MPYTFTLFIVHYTCLFLILLDNKRKNEKIESLSETILLCNVSLVALFILLILAILISNAY